MRLDVFPAAAVTRPSSSTRRIDGTQYAPDLDAASGGRIRCWKPRFARSRLAVRDIEVTIRLRPRARRPAPQRRLLVALLGALDRLAGGQRSDNEIGGSAHGSRPCVSGSSAAFRISSAPHSAGELHRDVRVSSRRCVALPLPDSLRRGRSTAGPGLPGPAHSSSAVHEKVERNLEQRGPDCAELESLRAAAERARDAVLAGDLAALGSAIATTPRRRPRFTRNSFTSDAWRVIEIAGAHRAAGWKVTGAVGDGGSMTLLGSGDRAARPRDRARDRQDNPAWSDPDRDQPRGVEDQVCGNLRQVPTPNFQFPKGISSNKSFWELEVGSWKLSSGRLIAHLNPRASSPDNRIGPRSSP